MQIQYLAPEMINQYYNHQCDIWSLGILLYALLSGNAPFTGASDSLSYIFRSETSRGIVIGSWQPIGNSWRAARTWS